MSTLNKISLDGTVYDIGGANAEIIHHTWTTESGSATSGDDLALGQTVLDKMLNGENVLIDMHTNDTPTYINNTYHTSYDGLYVLDNSAKSDGKYTNITYKRIQSTNVSSGSIYNFSSVSNNYVHLYITISNDVVTRTQVYYFYNSVQLLPTNNVKSYDPTDDYHPATKKYVDDHTLPYYDSGYYMQPTDWTIVSEMPDYPVNGRLYFVSPDYVEKNIGTSISSTGFNSGVSWSHITDYFLNTQDLDDVIQTWQNTAPSGASSGTQYTSWLVKVPKYGVAVGATPNFTNSYDEDLHMYGVLEQRNPQTTSLMYSAYLDVDENLASGTMYYFDRDEDHSGGTPLTIYGSEVSTTFFYTIGTNGGLACLKGDTPVKISNTKTKQIKNLAVGDSVIDAEGNKVKILKVFSHKVDTTFNITLSNEDVLVASYGHKFSINKHFRRACQILKDHKLDRNDGSTFDVIATEVKQEEMEVYEILTESGTYTLGNGIICECEAI